jgi:hypothetical protein
MISAAKSRPLDYRCARIRQCRASPSLLARTGRNRLCASFPRPPDHLFPKFCVRTRNTQTIHSLSVPSYSYCYLQGITVRPVPCNYNVIQHMSALSRRRRGFKSRRGRQIISLGAKCLLFVEREDHKSPEQRTPEDRKRLATGVQLTFSKQQWDASNFLAPGMPR